MEATFTAWRTLELGVKGEVFNIFDQQKARGTPATGANLTTWCGDASPDAPAACRNARNTFGATTARGAFQPPRSYRLTALVRF